MKAGDTVVFKYDFAQCKKGDKGEIISMITDTVAGKPIKRLVISTKKGNVRLAYSRHSRRQIIKVTK